MNEIMCIEQSQRCLGQKRLLLLKTYVKVPSDENMK